MESIPIPAHHPVALLNPCVITHVLFAFIHVLEPHYAPRGLCGDNNLLLLLLLPLLARPPLGGGG